VLARPGIRERLAAVGDASVSRAPLPGPDREQLLALLGGG
jgi:hypothetical protein